VSFLIAMVTIVFEVPRSAAECTMYSEPWQRCWTTSEQCETECPDLFDVEFDACVERCLDVRDACLDSCDD
ncbi:hypothetical protein LSAT2_026397, partial [Lamellibrachia satsuma]